MEYNVESLREGEKPFQSLIYNVKAKNKQEAIDKHEKEFSGRTVIAILRTYKYRKMVDKPKINKSNRDILEIIFNKK